MKGRAIDLENLPGAMSYGVNMDAFRDALIRKCEIGISVPASLIVPIFDDEEAFQTSFLLLAKVTDWKSAHFRPARTAKGWRTAVAGDGKGFPDNQIFRGPEKIAAELKMPGNKPTKDQTEWLSILAAAGFETYVWYPWDWQEIQARLSRLSG